MPKTRNECEIAEYRDVLNTIHKNFNHISIRDTFILQLHRDLYEFENVSLEMAAIQNINGTGISKINYWRTAMITGELKNRIDSLWEIFWTGGLTNPLDVIEQMTYLMFIHDLDVSDNIHAKESAMLGLP